MCPHIYSHIIYIYHAIPLQYVHPIHVIMSCGCVHENYATKTIHITHLYYILILYSYNVPSSVV